MNDLPENYEQRTQEIGKLMSLIGSTLTTWNQVEDALYYLFQKMVDVKNDDICSVLFYSPPSFESRRVLVDRVAHFALGKKEHESNKKEWDVLFKLLDKASAQRGRVAHFGVDYNLEITLDDPRPPKIVMGEPRLAPASHNKVDALKGRTVEKDAVTAALMIEYIQSFQELAARLTNLNRAIPFSPAPQSTNFLAKLLLMGPKTEVQLPSQKMLDLSKRAPSDPEDRQ